MQDQERIAVQLRALGERLVLEQERILQAWRESVRNDPELSTPRNIPRARFDDHIPGLLKTFAAQLAAWPGAGMMDEHAAQERRGAQHGANRWREGYGLPEVAREWVHLHLVLLDLLGTLQPFDADTLTLARRMLVLLCGQGVGRSVSEYVRMMQAEAAARVRDLEAALAAVDGLQRQRADAWREAAHDLRNTVGLVSNATGILRRVDAPEPMRQRTLVTLQTGVAALTTMLNDLLELARLEAGVEQRELSQFDAAGAVREVVERFRQRTSAAGIDIEGSGPDVLPVEGDEARVRRLVECLITYAANSCADGTVLVTWCAPADAKPSRWSLQVELGRPAAAPAGISIQEELEQVNAAASNVPPSGRPRMHGSGHGEGIALSLARRLCELLDAEFDLPAPGLRLHVTLPARYAAG
jgi:signal transduction histidine kinase